LLEYILRVAVKDVGSAPAYDRYSKKYSAYLVRVARNENTVASTSAGVITQAKAEKTL